MSQNGHSEDQGCWIEDLFGDASIEQGDIIEDILPAGLSVLIGSPKAGKTNFLKQAAADIATGRKFMDQFSCQPGKGRLLFYESSAGEIRKSFKNDGIPPKTIRFEQNFTKGIAGIHEIESVIERKEFKLIVVDTFGIFRGDAKLNDYSSQYKAFEPLNKSAMETNTALVVVTHTKQTARKNEVGSAGYRIQGLRAVATSNLVLDRNHNAATADLRIESRKGPDRHLKLRFDTASLKFNYLGEEDGNYVSDEMVAILKCLYRQGGLMKPLEIADYTGLQNKSAHNILKKLVKMGYVENPKRGLYLINDQGIVKAEQK